MKKILNTLSSKKGTSLLVVTVIFAILIIMGTSLITISSANYHNSVSYHYQKQSYYTAKSALDMVITAFNTKDQCIALMNQLNTNTKLINDKSASTPIAGLGSYDIKIENATPAGTNAKKEIKLEVKGEYKDKGTLLKATLKEGKGDHINPVEFVFFCMNGGIRKNTPLDEDFTIDGDILSRGSVNLNKLKVTGNFLNLGAIELRNSEIKGKLIVESGNRAGGSGGNIVFSNSKVIGEFYTNENDSIYYDPASIPIDTFDPPIDPTKLNEHFGINTSKFGIDANVQPDYKVVGPNFFEKDARNMYFSNGLIYETVDQYFIFPDGSRVGLCLDQEFIQDKKQKTSVTIPSKVMLSTPLPTPLSRYDGKATVDFVNRTLIMKDGLEINTVSNVITMKDESGNLQGIVDLANDKFIDSSGNTHLGLNNLYINRDGTYTEDSSLPVKVISNGMVITKDCKVDVENILNSNFVVDTSVYNKDINIYCKDGLILDNSDIEVRGDHNVYIYLGDSKPFTLSGTSKVGFNSHEETQLYVLGKGNNMQINNKARFKGVFYTTGTAELKYGTLQSLNTNQERIIGSISAPYINIAKKEKYKYVEALKPPKFHTTLETDKYFIYPPLEPGEYNWKVTYG